MAALRSRIWPTRSERGVTGSSQVHRYFTPRTRRKRCGTCSRSPPKQQQSEFEKESMFVRFRVLMVLALLAGLLSSCGIRRKKYENPITKDTQQPDKVLFDKAVNDIERSRYEIARLTLQTLINTYDTSEYLAKAKLAIADSWYREGGSHGLAQAEAEYKDFRLFYPNMEEAAEAQEKVCMIHYKQMEKADRDP